MGEIRNYAQPRIGGVPVAVWQCDKKTTWSDGSLQHAMISFTASVPALSSITVDFVSNTAPSSAGAPLTQAQMLNFDTGGGAGSWSAKTEVSAGAVTKPADARTMLAAGQWRYWLQGPVVTQVIVEDRTAVSDSPPGAIFALGRSIP